MRIILLFLLAVGIRCASAQVLVDPDNINLPYTKVVLDTGLRLIVHEDHKAPIVAVNVWYHVGSKNEKPGKSGMILASSKSSRLYKKLVYEDQVSAMVNAYNGTRELASEFVVSVRVKPGKDVDKVETIVNGILSDFVEKGPTQEELDRVKADLFAQIIKGLDRIGGFGGKSDILAESEIYGGSPDHYRQDLKLIANATVEDVHKAIKVWLTTGKHVIVCTPFPNYQVTGVEADRSKIGEKIWSVEKTRSTKEKRHRW